MSLPKRAFDIATSLLGLIFLSPFLAVAALVIRIFDGSPVLFSQTRVGLNGKQFKLLKFRTMRTHSKGSGSMVTASGDPRITSIGRILRRTKLDEFPQLVNVLRGEMSLVGPRPDLPEYVDTYSESEREILKLVPGITALASIVFRNEEEILASSSDPTDTYIRILQPEKIRLNLEYSRTASFWSDLKLVIATVLHLDPGITPSREFTKAISDSLSSR